MKQIVSNTTPIRYLAEINADYLLPVLFSQVLIPNAVLSELTHPRVNPRLLKSVSKFISGQMASPGFQNTER
jgi:predicted nucleic acid-binding protein